MSEHERFVLYHYTAEEAVQDGILFAVDHALSREAGYSIPVRITRGVKALVTPADEGEEESVEGRLWDALWAARVAILNADRHATMARFELTIDQKMTPLWACLDTTSGPAIHIIRPGEY